MAQFLTPFSVLLLIALFNPIVCPSSQIFNERRDRAPYIEPGEHSPQSLGDGVGLLGSRLRKPPAHKDSNLEQSTMPFNSYPANANKQTSTDSIIEKNIRTVFSTNYGPGLHIFPNTAPFNNPPHFNSYADTMFGDQPDPKTPSSLVSSASSSDKEFFKVQRSPNGKLSVIYNEDYVPKEETYTSKSITDHQGSISSNNENVANRFQTHFPGGLPLKKEKTESSTTVNYNRGKDVIHFPIDDQDKDDTNYQPDISDCDGKLFCTHLRNYPEKSYVEKIIKNKFSNLESFFGEDLIVPQNISQRMNNEPDEEFLCRSRTRIIYPEAGVNKDYNWLVIVNVPNYRQGIRIEECIQEGSSCGESNGLSLPNRYTAYCKQSYIYRSLVALVANDTLIKDQFKVPACCKCVLKAI